MDLKFVPIIVSSSILLMRVDEDFYDRDIALWNLYDIPHTDFLLLLHKDYESYYKKIGLEFQLIKNISSLLELSQKGSLDQFLSKKKVSFDQYYKSYLESNFKKFVQNPEHKPSPKAIHMEFLNVLFGSKLMYPNVIRDFVLSGHGQRGEKNPIAGIDFLSLYALLSFCDRHINTRSLLYFYLQRRWH